MHDFGANRVGGLPWSLYLASGAKICEQIVACLAEDSNSPEDFELVPRRSRFDPELLQAIQSRLYEFQEKEMTGPRGLECIEWFRNKREALQTETAFLHDGISWLLVAEAIMQCSLVRTEGRGFFFRFDFQNQDERLDQLLSCTWYDAASDSVMARLSPWEEVSRRVRPGNKTAESRLVYGSLAQHF
jgi:succinate dehydrogenase/fumarate reductase flavoprotein subunit